MQPEEKVILVDPHDHPLGLMPKMEAHRKGLLHRAFSVFIFDEQGRLMLQRRAATKYHSPGLWTNTVCSHQRLGETNREAGKRRLIEELGFTTELREIFHFIYKAELDRGLTEHELDHVLIGKYNGQAKPNPEEVDGIKYMHLAELKTDIEKNPENYTEWFKIIFRESYQILVKEAGKMFLNQPLFFDPYFEEKIWGGTALKTILNKNIPSNHTGESWEISSVKNKESHVKSGFFKGMPVSLLWNLFDRELWGSEIKRSYRNFPLLVKYIDANDDLSVQVHPDDQLASELHNSCGKTEMWRIISAQPGAALYIGFKTGTTEDIFLRHLKAGTLKNILNRIPVKAKEMFYIPAGTVHAIGKGILLAEVQQTSDLTYRIYDWNRVDQEGKRRELHMERALKAINFEAQPVKIVQSIRTPYFQTEEWKPGKTTSYQSETFTILVNTSDRKFRINDWSFKPGETVLLPAHHPFEIEGEGTLLKIKAAGEKQY